MFLFCVGKYKYHALPQNPRGGGMAWLSWLKFRGHPGGGRKGAEFVNLITFSGEGGGSRAVSCVFRGRKHVHIHVANGSLSLS